MKIKIEQKVLMNLTKRAGTPLSGTQQDIPTFLFEGDTSTNVLSIFCRGAVNETKVTTSAVVFEEANPNEKISFAVDATKIQVAVEGLSAGTISIELLAGTEDKQGKVRLKQNSMKIDLLQVIGVDMVSIAVASTEKNSKEEGKRVSFDIMTSVLNDIFSKVKILKQTEQSALLNVYLSFIQKPEYCYILRAMVTDGKQAQYYQPSVGKGYMNVKIQTGSGVVPFSEGNIIKALKWAEGLDKISIMSNDNQVILKSEDSFLTLDMVDIDDLEATSNKLNGLILRDSSGWTEAIVNKIEEFKNNFSYMNKLKIMKMGDIPSVDISVGEKDIVISSNCGNEFESVISDCSNKVVEGKPETLSLNATLLAPALSLLCSDPAIGKIKISLTDKMLICDAIFTEVIQERQYRYLLAILDSSRIKPKAVEA